jgi:hypothetical protein
MHSGFWWGNWKERDNLEDLIVEGDNIKSEVNEIVWDGVHWINLIQDWCKCQVS